MLVRVRHLGLAAYIKMNGAKLIGIDKRVFILETDRKLVEWQIDYNNSCCMKHDAAVCDLRVFLTDNH